MDAKVSVVMCTFNGAKYLREQIDTIINQTYPIYEIIIQDDGSTDDTVSIIKEYTHKHNNIKYFYNEAEHGVNGNFFSAMKRATGDFIAISDQDDLWDKDKIKQQVMAIGDAMLCTHRSEPFSEDGSFVFVDKRQPNITLLRMMYRSEIPGHTMLIKQELLQVLPSKECMMYYHNYYDAILAITAASFDGIVYIDNVLVHQRRYQKAQTYTSVKNSLPTFKNGIHILTWCLIHYHVIHKKSQSFYQMWEDFLNHIPTHNMTKNDGLKMMKLQQSTGLLGFIRFQVFCFRHRYELFHTRGKEPINTIRALLFPIMSCYYRRNHL